MQGEERCAEAGGECRLRFLYAPLGACKLAGITRYKMVLGHILGELGDRRQYAEGISGKENNGLGMSALAGNDAVGNILDRIRNTGILGNGRILKVEGSGILIDYNVFNKCSEADSVPDLRLVLLGEVYALRIAAAFEIEHSVIRPAVLVVSDKPAVWIRGEGGLSCSAKAEEQCGITVITDICRAMHGEHATLGH